MALPGPKRKPGHPRDRDPPDHHGHSAIGKQDNPEVEDGRPRGQGVEAHSCQDRRRRPHEPLE
eukprot:7795948-Heterocapsa_arctica.AAC.1